MEWVPSTLHATSEHGVSSITTTDAHTSTASSRLNWRPSDWNGLVRFGERRYLVSAHVPSHFNWPLHLLFTNYVQVGLRGLIKRQGFRYFEGIWLQYKEIFFFTCTW